MSNETTIQRFQHLLEWRDPAPDFEALNTMVTNQKLMPNAEFVVDAIVIAATSSAQNKF